MIPGDNNHLAVVLESERGATIASTQMYTQDFGDLLAFAWKARAGFPMFTRIDPVGTARFDEKDCVGLDRELGLLEAHTKTEGDRIAIGVLRHFARHCQMSAGSRLVIIGD